MQREWQGVGILKRCQPGHAPETLHWGTKTGSKIVLVATRETFGISFKWTDRLPIYKIADYACIAPRLNIVYYSTHLSLSLIHPEFQTTTEKNVETNKQTRTINKKWTTNKETDIGTKKETKASRYSNARVYQKGSYQTYK